MRRTWRRSLLLAAVVFSTAVGVGLGSIADAYDGKVLLQCLPNNSQRAAVDPLEFYGVTPSPHEHTPAGALAFNSRSTVREMLAAGTSCYLHADHSMAWVPTPLTPRGTPATIGSFDYYYFNAGYRIRRAPPDGLRFIAGKPHCAGQFCPAIYECRTVRGTLFTAHTIPSRQDGCDTSHHEGYEMLVYSSGQCWDGRSLGMGMGSSSPPANVTTARPCRGQVIPGLILALTVGPNGLGGYLSSDIMAGTSRSSPGSTGHFDYVFGWKHSPHSNPLMAVIKQCLDVTSYTTAQESCVETEPGGGGETIYRLSPRTGGAELSKCVTGPACATGYPRVLRASGSAGYVRGRSLLAVSMKAVEGSLFRNARDGGTLLDGF